MQYILPENDPGIFQVSRLSNGIPIYHRQSAQILGKPNLACSVLVQVGGRDDPRGKEGSAHFFEHMPFRGTKTYPTLYDLTYPIEREGGYVNAFTTDEATGYEIILPSELSEEGIKRTADMLRFPLLKEDDIETERAVILEELRNKLSSVHFYARQELFRGLLGDHPLVHAVIGTEAALLSVGKDDLAAFHSQYYNANNIAIFIAGTYDIDQVILQCEKYFGSVQEGTPTKRNTPLAPFIKKESVQVLSPKRYNRSVYMTGRTIPHATLKESLLNKIFRDMLLRGMNSPLYAEIRDKRGLAYNLGFSHSRYQDVGLLIFSVATQFRHMDEVDEIFWNQATTILQNKSRFDEVKHMFRQSVLHREYAVGALVDTAIDSYLEYNRIVSLDEFLSVLDAITLEEVSDAISHYLNRDDFLTIRVNCDETNEE